MDTSYSRLQLIHTCLPFEEYQTSIQKQKENEKNRKKENEKNGEHHKNKKTCCEGKKFRHFPSLRLGNQCEYNYCIEYCNKIHSTTVFFSLSQVYVFPNGENDGYNVINEAAVTTVKSKQKK